MQRSKVRQTMHDWATEKEEFPENAIEILIEQGLLEDMKAEGDVDASNYPEWVLDALLAGDYLELDEVEEESVPREHMTQTTLDERLTQHELWVATKESDSVQGKRLYLENTDFTGMDFSGRNLQGAVFQMNDFDYASFAGSNLTGAHFEASRLIGVNTAGANLTAVTYDWNYIQNTKGFPDMDGHTKMPRPELQLTDADLEGLSEQTDQQI